MALGIDTSPGGDFVGIVKYDARVGRMFRIERTLVNGTWEALPDDITDTFRAIVDLENIEVGWLNFKPGAPPTMHLVRPGQDPGPQPGETHKQGYRVLMYLAGDKKPIREASSNAKAAIEGMDKLHGDYLAGVKDHPGMLPVVKLGKPIIRITTGGGQKTTNYIPQYVIEEWVARPADFEWKARVEPQSKEQKPDEQQRQSTLGFG